MQRDGGYWLECAASRGGVDEARALEAFECAWDEQICEIIAKNGHVELLKWIRAQPPPCPCDFEACLELAEEGRAVRAYIQMALHFLAMCQTETKDMTATETADAVALIDQGADVNATDSDIWTPLHYAVNGYAEMVMALLDQGADAQAKTIDEWTPLLKACQNDHAEVVMALLDKSADVQAKDSGGWTPLHGACENGHHNIAAMLRMKSTVE
jgi:hypothetical protein